MLHRLRLLLLAACTAGAIVTTAALPTFAAEAPQFHVYNQGDHTIAELYVWPHGSSDVGADLLGDYYLYAGYNDTPLANYTLPSCYQNVEAIYTNRHYEILWNVDVCNNDVRFYY